MTVDELGRLVKSKHPEYSQYEDSEVGARTASKYPEYRAQISDPAQASDTGGIMDKVKQAVSYAPKVALGLEAMGNPIQALSTYNAQKIDEGTRDLAQRAGGEVAEAGGKMGYPKTGVAAGMAVSMAPDIAGAVVGNEAIRGTGSPTLKGMLNTPQELGKEYDALHAAAGISKRLPEVRGSVAKFPDLAGQPSKTPPVFAPAIAPSSYPSDPNAMINFVRARIEGLGDKLSPQELNDQKVLMGQLIETGKLGQGTPFAMASDLRNKAATLLQNRVEGLADLNKAYALSKKVQNPSQFIPEAVRNLANKYGKWVIGAAALGGGYKALSGNP